MEIAPRNVVSKKLQAQRLARLTQLGYENTLRVNVHKCRGEAIEELRCDDTDADIDLTPVSKPSSTSVPEPMVETPRTIRALAASPFVDYANAVYRRNVILTNGDKVLLQRFGFPTHRYLSKQRSSVAAGLSLLKQVYSIAKYHNRNAKRAKVPIYTFGIWHTRFDKTPIITSDTLQLKGRNRVAASKAVKAFLAWFKQYTNSFIVPLLDEKYNMASEIRRSYQSREAVYHWLSKQVSNAEDYTHPLFATCSTFSTFSPGEHIDAKDMEYSFMVNFGGSCYLNFPDHNIRVHLQPFDVVFFRSKDTLHSTDATPASAVEAGTRWGVSGYVRSSFARQAGVV